MSHIVIVAPRADNVTALKARLEGIDHKVTQLDQTLGVMTAVARLHPELVILSDEASRIDCMELCEKFANNAELAKIPVILLSQFEDPKQGYTIASTAGAQGAISRSWVPAQMQAWVMSFLAGKRPLLPGNEKQRMETLRGYKILDTPPDEAFDDLVRIASIVCQTPISLVSLVDEQRQWFKARVGLAATQTSREHAFCAHAVRQRDILEIPDAQRDVRFAENPLVVGDPGIRFYAGAPLTGTDGTAAGTLCVIDRKPRVLTMEQREVLKALSRVATRLLTSRG